MDVAVVTGAGGLVGAATTRAFADRGYRVIGIDNDMRARFFGADASTKWSIDDLVSELPEFEYVAADIRDTAALESIFGAHRDAIKAVVHTAAQPSHDWAARDPVTDFTINAEGTLLLLEATRKHCPEATFIFCSTNKVYGDTPNALPLVEFETRLELDPTHRWAEHGIDETMSIDTSTHSLFGVSKAAADLLVQEYGRYFGMNTIALRAGCLTGPGHSGAQLHGFLAHLMRCTAVGLPYTVIGYDGKQVRDNLHAADLAAAFCVIHDGFADGTAGVGGRAFNMGGGRFANCSVREAIALCQEIAGRPLTWTYDDAARIGDHRWWISDVRAFCEQYPQWQPKHDIAGILEAIFVEGRTRWTT
jgi:CDP-paratose 2-epimerase